MNRPYSLFQSPPARKLPRIRPDSESRLPLELSWFLHRLTNNFLLLDFSENALRPKLVNSLAFPNKHRCNSLRIRHIVQIFRQSRIDCIPLIFFFFPTYLKWNVSSKLESEFTDYICERCDFCVFCLERLDILCHLLFEQVILVFQRLQMCPSSFKLLLYFLLFYSQHVDRAFVSVYLAIRIFICAD